MLDIEDEDGEEDGDDDTRLVVATVLYTTNTTSFSFISSRTIVLSCQQTRLEEVK